MKYYKYLLGILLLSVALATNAITNTGPNAKYDHVLSKDHPLTVQELSTIKSGFSTIQSGKDTYTFVRCYYKTAFSFTKPATDYQWAKDPKTDKDYTLSGYWYADGIDQWKNMFYTNTLASDIKSACEYTLKKYNKGVLLDIYAADNSLSFDHTIWHNNLGISTGDYDRIVSFGDSLSDTHNIYNASQWKLPNNKSWFLGRFSNYKVWIEYLAEDLQIPYYNWAVGGASTATNYMVIPSLSEQVKSYKEYMAEAKNYNSNKTLFTVWIGANDLVKYDRTVSETLDNINNGLNELIKAGALHILVLNLPDASIAPVFKYKKNGDAVHKNIVEFNSKLAQSIATIKSTYGSSLDIQLFDTYTIFHAVIENHDKYQISNVTDSCLDINEDSSSKYLNEQKVRAKCVDSSQYIFWDLLHPTSRMHEILASQVLGALTEPKTSPTDNFIYINNFEGYNVSVRKLDTNYGTSSPVNTINISTPSKMIFDDKKSYAYILSAFGDAISTYTVEKSGALTPISPRDTNPSPDTLDMAYANGYIYTISDYSISVYKQNINGSLALQSRDTSSSQTGFRHISINNNKVYILNKYTVFIYNISSTNGNLTYQSQFRLNNEASGLKFGKGSYSKFGFVLSDKTKTISAINQSGDVITSSLDFAPTDIEFSKDGSLAYITHFGSKKISILSIKSDGKLQLLNTINTVSDPYSISIDSFGKYIFVTNLYDASVSQYKIITNTPYLTGFNTFASEGRSPSSIAIIGK